MTEEQFAIWLAGFIDGEGCIAIYHHTYCKCLNPVVQITLTDEDILRMIHGRTGIGAVIKRRLYGERCSQSWKWQATGHGAYVVCMMVLPYLQLKHRQAELLVEYWSKRPIAGTKVLPDDELFIKRSRELNRKPFLK